MTLPKKNKIPTTQEVEQLILNANYKLAIDECLLLVKDEIEGWSGDSYMAEEICSSVRKQLMGDE